MSSPIAHLTAREWRSSESYGSHLPRPLLEKLRSTQFRNGSPYLKLRSVVPVLVLGMTWLRVTFSNASYGPRLFFDHSVTVRHLLLVFGILGLWNVLLGMSVYGRRSGKDDLRAEVGRLLLVSVTCSLSFLFLNSNQSSQSQDVLFTCWTAMGLFTTSLLVLAGFLLGAKVSPKVARRRPALLVGTGPRAAVLKKRLDSPYSSYQICGLIDDEYLGHKEETDAYLGRIDQLESLLKAHPIETVLIRLPLRSQYDQIQRVIRICESAGVETRYAHDIFQTSHARVRPQVQEPDHLLLSSTEAPDPRRMVKRLIDLLGSAILLVLFSPVMLAAALAVYVSSPGPVFFVQRRYGFHRKIFRMFKFRSMVEDAEQRQAELESLNEVQGPVFKISSDPRVTRVGAFLRRTSIDELPQLLNVLRGEMSLVGPRPLPLRDVSRFQENRLLRRFSVRPGLTCLWQVRGRSHSGFDAWIRQDLEYIDQWSLGLDLKVLLLTITAVLKGNGAM